MGRNREYKNRVAITAYLESEEFQALEDIRWRDHKDITQVIRAAVIDYVKAHGAGNETFRLDNWQEDPTFTAVPTLFTSYDKWQNYVDGCSKEEKLKLLKSLTEKRTYLSARL